MKISKILVNEIADSRGAATLEAVLSSGDMEAKGAVPSGKSTGSHEALELRDADGGVSAAKKNVLEIIGPELMAKEWSSPEEIDRALISLDGTKNKTRLGANALLGVSIAAHRLFAGSVSIPLWKLISESNNTTPKTPRLFMNVMNGGAHADFRLPFQEYILIVNGKTARDSYERAQVAFATLGNMLKDCCGNIPLGDEGGYSPLFSDVEQPFSLLSSLSAGLHDMSIGIDAAATEFFKKEQYIVSGQAHSRAELLALYETLIDSYHVASIEDPFAEHDVEGFTELTKRAQGKALVIGDDLTVTNPELIKKFSASRSATGVIIKPNQIGTVTETCEAARVARDAGWEIVVSHRSGETHDTFVSDLAFGLGAYGLKAGAPTQEVRRVKYERLLEAEEEFLHNTK